MSIKNKLFSLFKQKDITNKKNLNKEFVRLDPPLEYTLKQLCDAKDEFHRIGYEVCKQRVLRTLSCSDEWNGISIEILEKIKNLLEKNL